MPVQRCYMCSKPAVSREHVPPRNLFPEAKDLGSDYRSNLITVPSCAQHNSSKSHDDEFLMASLAGIVGNNPVGLMHKFTKVDRAIKRTKGVLLDRVFKTKKSEEVFETAFGPHCILWGSPDGNRLLRCFNSIARGLHFSHFGHRFKGTVKTHLSYLIHHEANPHAFGEFLKHRAEIDLRGKPPIGANPDVFYYQATDKDEFGLFLMKLCFYGGIAVHSAFLPKGCRLPFNLGSHMMNAGIHTVLNLEGRQYVFNDQ